MNRDDVIRLIERVSNKALYTMVGEEPFYTSETEDEIFKKLDSSGVAEAVTDAVGDAVADLVRVKEYFEAVSLPVSFNIFLNVDDINEEGEYINGVRTLHDYVGVEFPLKNEYYYSGKRNTKTYVYHEPAEDSDEELDEGWKDKFKKGAATLGVAASLAGNAMAHDPMYDGATRPFEDTDMTVQQVEMQEKAKKLPNGMIKDEFGNEWTEREWQKIINGEDPYADGARNPQIEESDDDMLNVDIAECLKAAGVKI